VLTLLVMAYPMEIGSPVPSVVTVSASLMDVERAEGGRKRVQKETVVRAGAAVGVRVAVRV